MDLAHALIVGAGATPTSYTLFLHGILGRGSNLRTLARRFVERRPERGAVLVDLRLHGGSQGFAPPHTVAAAASDLIALERALGPGRPVRGVCGHSFGGKVALAYLAQRADLRDDALAAAWILDAMPGPRGGDHEVGGDASIPALIALLASLPRELPSREDFTRRLEAAGVAAATAGWLAMNLTPRPGAEPRFALALDLAGIASLLGDYFALDLWPVVESQRGTAHLGLVLGARSPVFRPADRARAGGAAAASRGRLTVDTVDAGHYVHVDALDAVVRILTACP